jgi:hypothetical protein
MRPSQKEIAADPARSTAKKTKAVCNMQHFSAAVKAAYKRRNAAWRGLLGKLTKRRHGNHYLPDDNRGRAMLVAFMRCQLMDDDAKERAPWVTDDELKKLRRKARRLTLEQIGTLISLTYAERMACRVFFLPACDITREEALRRQAERNRENARKRQAKLRESKMTMRHTSERDDAVLRMLTMLPTTTLGGWTAASVLVKEAKRCDAFRRPDGRRQRDSAMRKAVHRVLETLKAHGQIETTEQPGARGMVTLVRRVDMENGPKNAERDGFCHGGNVAASKRVKTSTEQVLTLLPAVSRCESTETQHDQATPSKPHTPAVAVAGSNIIQFKPKQSRSVWTRPRIWEQSPDGTLIPLEEAAPLRLAA